MPGRTGPPARWLIAGFILAGLLLGACGASTAATRVAPTEPPAGPPSASPQATATSTSVSGTVILLSPEGGTDPVLQGLRGELERLARESGFKFSARESADIQAIDGNLAVLVVYRANSELFQQLDAAGVDPSRILAVAPVEALPTDGPTVIGPNGLRSDRAAFLAGYSAAVISPNYRVGVISAEGVSPPGSATAFMNGARYYCGLCRAAYPPFADYPASVRLTGSSVDGEAAVQRLADQSVQSVYLAPGLESGPLPTALTRAGIRILAQSRPADVPDEGWIASVRPAPELALIEVWESFNSGASPGSLPMPFLVSDRNPDYFSEARYRVVEEVLQDLIAGYISTGVSGP